MHLWYLFARVFMTFHMENTRSHLADSKCHSINHTSRSRLTTQAISTSLPPLVLNIQTHITHSYNSWLKLATSLGATRFPLSPLHLSSLFHCYSFICFVSFVIVKTLSLSPSEPWTSAAASITSFLPLSLQQQMKLSLLAKVQVTANELVIRTLFHQHTGRAWE